MNFSREKSNGYPSAMEVESAAVMARDLKKIHNLFALLAELRRVPPGLIKNFDTWVAACDVSTEAGVLMRVAQISYINKLDLIPNRDDTYTHFADTNMSFRPYKHHNHLFVNNIQITIDVPKLDDCDIHVYETDASILLKYDTKFKFEKCGRDRYTVRLPGFHELSSICYNKLNLIFTSKDIKHVPITVLIEYDYVFVKSRLGLTLSEILKRYTCTRISDKLAIKYIPNEPNKRAEIFAVEPPPVKFDPIREVLNAYSLFKNVDDRLVGDRTKNKTKTIEYIKQIMMDHFISIEDLTAVDTLADKLPIDDSDEESVVVSAQNMAMAITNAKAKMEEYKAERILSIKTHFDKDTDLLLDNHMRLDKIQKDIINFLYSIDDNDLQYKHPDSEFDKRIKDYFYPEIYLDVDAYGTAGVITDVREFYEKLLDLFERNTGYPRHALQQFLDKTNFEHHVNKQYSVLRRKLIDEILSMKIATISIFQTSNLVTPSDFSLVIFCDS